MLCSSFSQSVVHSILARESPEMLVKNRVLGPAFHGGILESLKESGNLHFKILKFDNHRHRATVGKIYRKIIRDSNIMK